MKALKIPEYVQQILGSHQLVAVITILVILGVVAILWSLNDKYNKQTGYDQVGL